MYKEDISKINNAISVLIGQPLRSVSRAGSMIMVNFGDFIEKKTSERMKASDRNSDRAIVGNLALHIECCARFTCGNEIIFAKSDIFLPGIHLLDSLDLKWSGFEWDVLGSNYFDEMVSKHFGEHMHGFVVKEVFISKFGDLRISFENNFVLELFADGSGGSENWRFFEVNSDNAHLVVFGDSIDFRGGERGFV